MSQRFLVTPMARDVTTTASVRKLIMAPCSVYVMRAIMDFGVRCITHVPSLRPASMADHASCWRVGCTAVAAGSASLVTSASTIDPVIITSVKITAPVSTPLKGMCATVTTDLEVSLNQLNRCFELKTP